MRLNTLQGRINRRIQLQSFGMASNILAVRLKKLQANGLISKTVVPQDARRFDYALTEKGNDLFPLLMTLLAWGDKWSPGDKGRWLNYVMRVAAS